MNKDEPENVDVWPSCPCHNGVLLVKEDKCNIHAYSYVFINIIKTLCKVMITTNNYDKEKADNLIVHS